MPLLQTLQAPAGSGKQRSDYIGIREVKPEQIREHQAVSALAFNADWQQIGEGAGIEQ